jgi:hypothetical protein
MSIVIKNFNIRYTTVRNEAVRNEREREQCILAWSKGKVVPVLNQLPHYGWLQMMLAIITNKFK